MEIIKPDLKFTKALTPLNLSKVDGIAIHHSEHETADIYEIHKWHLGNGWLGVGYNYFIDKQGRIFEGRGLNVGSHTGDNNSHLIGICFQGDYHNVKRVMPDVQYNAGVWLAKRIASILGRSVALEGHNYWRATMCPGQYFPLSELRELKYRGVEEMASKYFKDVTADWQAVHIDALKERGVVSGRTDKEFDPDAPITRAEAAVVVNKAIEYIIKELK